MARVLIVEDEILVAMNIEASVEDLGHEAIGIASDLPSAIKLAAKGADVALVDLNLRDGMTGPQIGRVLSRDHDIAVVFITANPGSLGTGVPGAIGVVSKPVEDYMVCEIVDYALARRAMRTPTPAPPPGLRVFA